MFHMQAHGFAPWLGKVPQDTWCAPHQSSSSNKSALPQVSFPLCKDPCLPAGAIWSPPGHPIVPFILCLWTSASSPRPPVHASSPTPNPHRGSALPYSVTSHLPETPQLHPLELTACDKHKLILSWKGNLFPRNPVNIPSPIHCNQRLVFPQVHASEAARSFSLQAWVALCL